MAYTKKIGITEANRLDVSRAHKFVYSLTQRVFMTFAEARQPLDRAHVRLILGVGDLGLEHALRRLREANCVRPARRGFFEFVPGAKIPVDARGTNARSFGNRGRRAG